MAHLYATSSFEEHAAKLKFFTECPIQWDGKRKCLRYKSPVGNGKVQIWHVSMFLNVDTITAGSLLYNLFQVLRALPEEPYMPLSAALILALLGILSYYVIVIHVMISLYGKDAVYGWNEVVKIEDELVGRMGPVEKDEPKMPEEFHATHAASLIFLVRSFSIYRFLVLPSEFFMKFDCFYFIIRDLDETYNLSLPTMVISNLLRFVLLIVNVFEICRALSLVILCFVTALNMWRE
ncbi:uncharacterized protein LOC118439370 [Folsomia candida]|uniref:uncharacterized protein LOC118439370 n=1 Tax=Folsomia candida TaxID=158441 RepID=UPI001604DEC8|nr:uncharacterized protein LOC118439370 [Folsomia candida]